MSVTISMGTKKKVYKSIRLAAEANNISYMVLYMRLRAGVAPGTAARKPVRSYRRKPVVAADALVSVGN